MIQPGDVLHCDVGITVARLNTDTQHNAYVLRPGEADAPAGLKKALANANAMLDIAMEETRPGRSGTEVLQSVLARMKAKGIDGTMYTHPIGLNGHGARAARRTLGLSGRRTGPRRGEGDSVDVVFDRAASDDASARVGRSVGGHGGGRGHDRRRRRQGAGALQRQDALFLIKSQR